MTVIRKNSLLKRITAFVLALLMVFTLMPWENYVTLAEDEGAEGSVNTPIEYSFVVTDVDGNALQGAKVYLYDMSEDTTIETETTLVKETDAEGKVTFSSAEDGYAAVAEADIYKVVGTGTQTYVRGTLTTASEIVVKLPSLGLYLSCTVTLDGTAQSGANVYLLNGTNSDGTAEIVAQQLTDTNGFVQFTDGLAAGTYELIAITDTHKGTAEKVITSDDVTNAGSTEVVLNVENGIALTEKTDASFTLIEMVGALSLGETSTIQPQNNTAVKIGSPVFTYVSNNTDVATVDENGKVAAIGKGEAVITISMSTEEYKTVSATYTVTIDGANITGKVLDASSQPISGAVVKLISGETVIKTVNVFEGIYTFDGIGAGEYKVLVECAGYASGEKTVTVSADDESNKSSVSVDDISIARDSYNISGIVKDAKDNLVKGVTVKLVKGEITSIDGITDENTVATYISDTETAAYSLGYVVPETYTVVISDANYGTYFETITITDVDIVKDIVLREKVTVSFTDMDLLNNIGLDAQVASSTCTVTKATDSSVLSNLKDFNITYAIDSENVVTIDSEGKVTLINALGKATITATITSDKYEINETGSDLSYEVGVWEFAFVDANLKDTVTKIYGEGNFSTKAILKGADESTTKEVEVTYSSSNDDITKISNVVDGATGNVTDVQVQITGANDTPATITASYGGAIISYDVKVNQADTAVITWNGISEGDTKNYVYGASVAPETITASITGADNTAKIEYASDKEDIVVVDADGNIELKGVTEENESVKITATIVSDNYVAKETYYYITVEKGEQDTFAWQNADGSVYDFGETPNQVTLYFDGDEPTIVAGGNKEPDYNKVTYKLYKLVDGQKVEDTEEKVIKINPSTGAFEITGVGTAIVEATVQATDDAIASGNAHYKEDTISYTVVVSKATDPQLKWQGYDATSEPIVKSYVYNGSVETITASVVDNTNIKIKYESSHPDVVYVDEYTGEVKIKDVTTDGGNVTITATTVSDYYEQQTKTYTIEVGQGKQDKFDWQYDFGDTPNEITLKYDETVPDIVAGGQYEPADGDVTYKVESLDDREGCAVTVDSTTGKITVNRVGKALVTATVADKRHFATKDITYTIIINKADQSDFKWNNGYTDETVAKIVYAPSKTITNVLAINACSEATVTYSSSNDDIASVHPTTGAVTIHNVGQVTITATATVPDAGNYNTRSISYTYNVTQSAHTAFAWKGGNPGTVKLTYEDAAPNPVAVGQCENAVVTYTSSNPSVASVDSATGVVTIKKAGEATITATAAATRNYSETKISYKLVIAKKAQNMSFAQETYTLINGYNKFVSPVITTQNVTATASKIVYSVPENNGVVTINPTTGELEFTLQPGTVTVTATKPTDEQYIGTETEYTLTVLEWDPLKGGKTNPYYTVTGTQEDASSSWFTHYSKNDPVQLTAGTNYVLYKSEKDPVPNTKWASAISVSNVHEGKDNTITFYVKDTVNGYVSKQYNLNNIKVDSVVPTASIAIDDVTIWEKILSFFTFDLAGQDTPELEITSSDKTSGVKAVYYYISNTTEPLESKGLIDVNALEKEADWKTYDGVVDLEDEEVTKNVIYAKVVDKAGNSTYVATNGLIFDGTKPVVTPTIVTKDVNGYYNKNVEINLDVVDAEPYSGVKEITYVVENDGKVTDSGTLYTFEPKEEDNPKHSELISEWNSDDYDKNVIVKAADNNSDDVKVTFTVTDNAGNTTESVVELKIDITDPIINVVYDNNNGDATFADGVYFNADRTATITVSERHFNKDEFILTITNSDGTIPELSKWTKTSKGTGNGDDITYTATVYFSADGDYTLDISYVDEAGNKCDEVNYGESQAPTAFTVDKTIPTISVSYDNNDALNENYFKTDRTATVVIQEHNFDASRVNAIITATDNGEPIAAPVISGWSTSGDTHTATISYSSDALYSFDIEYLDKAGNSIVDVAEQSFYVDKTMPQVSITEIVDQSANNAEKIGFVITATDTNFDVFTPVLTAVIQTENGITTTELEAGSISEITNGQIYTVDNLDADGIYSITCTVIDKAGNAYTEVNLQREDGSTYVENRAGEDTLLMFSVNRDGSTFAVDDSTQSVLDNEYIQNIENDIVIYEVNTNELVSYALTLNGEELTEGTDYTVTSTGGAGTWMRYTYTVNKELFEAEGEYILVVSSTDGAENNAFSDVKNANISFVVDRTAPIVTVTGMESNRSYQTEAQIVTVMPTDDGGIIESLIINFVDRDGNITDEIFAKSGEELRELLETNGGLITFELSDVVNANIQIICTDKAYNTNGQSNTFNQIYENITVSASAVAIFFAGNTIYYILGGVAAVAALGVGAGIFLKKSKASKVKND